MTSSKAADRTAFSIIMGPRKGMKERIVALAMRLQDADLETVSRTFGAQGPAIWRYWVDAMKAREKAGMTVPSWMHPRKNPSKTKKAIPRIYVANLAAYNAGRLRGAWIEPSSDREELAGQILAAIGGNPDNEWAFHDYDAFPDMGEHPSLKDVAAMAELLEEHPYAIVRAAQGFVDRDDVDALREWLDEGYGTYKSKIDYVEQLVDDMGGPSALGKQTIDSYFDYDAFGHDVLIEADEEDRERYEGMSDREIGESFLDDVYGDKIPKDLAERYFDYDAYARDVFMEVASVRTPEGLVVFNAR
jgi:antirestriction protein